MKKLQLKLKKHILLLLSLLFLFITFSGYSQAIKKDTLYLIQEQIDLAEKAIITQRFNEASDNLKIANHLIFASKKDSLKPYLYVSSAHLNSSLHNYNKATYEVEKAIELLKNKKNKKLLARSYLLYGFALIQTSNFTKAENILTEADYIFTNNNNEKHQAITSFYFGILEFKKNNYRIALNYFDASYNQFKTNNLKELTSKCLLYKAESYLKVEKEVSNQNLEKAKKSLTESLNIINKNSFTTLKVKSHKIKSLIAIKENNFEIADKYLNLYTYQKDSLTQQYINYISKKTLEERNIEDYNEIIEAQRQEILENIKAINLGKTTTGLSIALIIILSLLALSLFKNNNLRAKANDLLRDRTVELTFSKDRAERASIIKAQFLSTITHELRTPLYAVTGLTHLLLEEDPKPEQKEHLNSLKYSGEHLLSLINNILDLNKLEANKVEIEKIPFHLKKRINDVLVALKRTSQDRKNKLTFEYDEGIPTKIVGDSLKLSQILMNLIGNSIKFTQNGEISVRAKKIKQTDNEVRVRIEVEDNGVGISKKKQKSIFETFSQGSLQINRKFGGTGLGLSIVKNLLEIMNSKIYLESEISQGSKFWFDISFEIAENKNDAIDTKKINYGVDYASLENVSALVVEDNKINQMITKKILEKNKMKCMVADNGTDAIEMVKKINYDLILMDIHMPGISGIVATQNIRKFNPDIPIIALTAVTIDENLDDFYNAGFNDIIPKPFKPEDFFEKIHKTLEKSKKKRL